MRATLTAANSVNSLVGGSVASPQLFPIQMSYELLLHRGILIKDCLSRVVRLGEISTWQDGPHPSN